MTPKLRAFDPSADVPPLVQLLRAAGETTTEAELRYHLSLPTHDPARDRWVLAHPDRRGLIGHAALYLPAESDDRPTADAQLTVHPQWRRRGHGAQLLGRVKERLLERPGLALRFYLEPRDEAAASFAAAQGFAPNPWDSHVKLRAALAGLGAPQFPEGFSVRSYREVSHLPTLVDALNRSYEGLDGHHRTTEADFAPHLADLDPDGTLLLFRAGEVAGIAAAQVAQDGEGHLGCPGVVLEHRAPALYEALLLAGAAYLRRAGARWVTLEGWGEPPETLALYAGLGLELVRREVAYLRP